jgi:hypothetical protein
MRREVCRFGLVASLAFAVVCLTAVGARAQGAAATAEDDHWHFEASLPLWAPGLDGTVSFKGIPPQPVTASFSDVISNFDIGLMGHFEARRNRFGFGADLLYLNLGADITTSGPILGQLDPQADLRQLTTEGFVFYRLAKGGRVARNQGFADLIVGTRYYGIRSQIKGDSFEGTKRTFGFVDGLIGLRGYAPLGSKWGLRARADIAGFGSKVTWNLEGDLGVLLSERWTIDAGYRYLDIDYDKGQGLDQKTYKMKTKGPVLTVRFAW